MLNLNQFQLNDEYLLVEEIHLVKETTQAGVIKTAQTLERERLSPTFIGKIIAGSGTFGGKILNTDEVIVCSKNLLEPFTLPINGTKEAVYLISTKYIFATVQEIKEG